MIDPRHVQLGKRPFTRDRRDLLLKDYIEAGRILDSAAIPGAIDWFAQPRLDGTRVPYDRNPLGNLTKGCCVFSGLAHKARRVGQLTGNRTLAGITEADVLQSYAEHTDGQDVGYVVRDLLKEARRVPIFGCVMVDAFAMVDWLDPIERLVACVLGCGTLDGYLLPLSAQGQTDDRGRQLWDVPEGGFPAGQGPGSWGGHCIDQHAEGGDISEGDSWGERTAQTERFKLATCDESWLVLIHGWGGLNGRAPNGFAYQDLLADAQARAGGSGWPEAM